MLNFRRIIAFISIFSQLEATTSVISSLKLVSVLFRHGDRTPIEMIPNDIHTKEDWPLGLGQLTATGIAQEKALGEFLRQQYDGYINNTYNRKQLHIRSTDVDRTLISAQSVIAGLYPSSVVEKSITGLSHQLVPVHTVPSGQDTVMGWYPYMDCPKYKDINNRTAYSPEYIYNNSKFDDLYRYLYNHTGLTDLSLFNLHHVPDTMFIEKVDNMTWPSWMTSTLYHRIRDELYPLKWFYENCGSEIRQYHGGPLLSKILQDMNLRRDGLLNDPPLKMILYSGHDSTVSSLLCALDIIVGKIPYSTAVIVELHEEPVAATWHVRLFLRNDTSGSKHSLDIPGCSAPCLLSTLVNVTSSVMPGTFDEMCYYESDWLQTSLKNLPLFILVSMLIAISSLIVLLSLVYTCHRKCMRRPVKVRHYGKIRVDAPLEEMPMMSNSSDLDD